MALPQLLVATGCWDAVFLHYLEPLHGKWPFSTQPVLPLHSWQPGAIQRTSSPVRCGARLSAGENYADAWFGAIHNAFTKVRVHPCLCIFASVPSLCVCLFLPLSLSFSLSLSLSLSRALPVSSAPAPAPAVDRASPTPMHHPLRRQADIHALEEIGQLTQCSREKKSRQLRGNQSWILSPYALTNWGDFLDEYIVASGTADLGFMACHAQIFGNVSLGFDRTQSSATTGDLVDRFAHAPAGQCTMTLDPSCTGKADTDKYKYYIPFKKEAKIPATTPAFTMRPAKTRGPAASTCLKNDFRSSAHQFAVTGRTVGKKFSGFDGRAKAREYFLRGFTGALQDAEAPLVSTSRHSVRACGRAEGVIGARAPCPFFVAGCQDRPVAELLADEAVRWHDPDDPVLPPLGLDNPFRAAAAGLVRKPPPVGTWLLGDILQELCDVDLGAELAKLAANAHLAANAVPASAASLPDTPATLAARAGRLKKKASGSAGVYADNAANRKAGRAGKPYGWCHTRWRRCRYREGDDLYFFHLPGTDATGPAASAGPGTAGISQWDSPKEAAGGGSKDIVVPDAKKRGDPKRSAVPDPLPAR